MAAVNHILLLFLYFTFLQHSSSFEIQYNTIETCKEAKKYFRISDLQCIECDEEKSEVSSDGLKCTCQPGYFINTYYGGPDLSCTQCSSGQASSEDRWFCLNCQFGSTARNGRCEACTNNRFAIERDVEGPKLTRRQCTRCTSDTTLTTTNNYCTKCPSCGLLFKDNLNPKVYEITYENNVKIESEFYQQNLIIAKTLCETKLNFTACQLLANLCVMLDYQFTPDSACDGYRIMVNKPPGTTQTKVQSIDGVENANWPIFMPWLYYLNSQQDANIVLNSKDIIIEFKIGQSLPFILAQYTVNGTFIGLTSDITQLQMCVRRPKLTAAADKFGTLYENNCEVSVKELWQEKQMFFYDLYFKSSTNTLYAIPLLLENYKEKNVYVNKDSSMESWRLLRRFFMVDNVSGRPKLPDKSTTKQNTDQVLRFAEKIEVHMRLRNGNGQIYPPFIKVAYKSMTINDDILKQNPSVNIKFKIRYEMDISSINSDIKTAVGVLSGIALAYAFTLVYSWRRRGGIEVIDLPTMLHFIAFLFGTLSTMYFWILFGMSSLWLIFFKEQDIVYRLLPTSDQEEIFRNLLIISFVFKMVDLYHVLSSQLNIDVFFIDWERPRPLPRGNNQGVDPKAPVSVWRTLFIGNEWNELQTLRKISPEIQIGLLLLFLKVIGFEHLTTTDPIRRYSVNPDTDYVGVESHVLRFAVAVLLYMTIAFIQWLFFAFIYERFLGDPFGDFIDLCSMANISVVVFQNKLYGYYLHGRSVHGRSDTDLLEMHEQFKREEEDLCGKRGLEPNNERQTFEIMVTRKFRATYDRFYDPIRSQTQNMERRNMPQTQGPHSTGANLSVAIQQSIEAYSSVNKFLSAFIDHSLRDVDYAVKNKLLLERMLDIEMGEIPTDKAILYNDDSRSFTNIFYFGHEWTLLLWDFLFFAIVDYISTDFVLSGVLTYLQYRIIKSAREAFGEKNLARKTLIDERFLI